MKCSLGLAGSDSGWEQCRGTPQAHKVSTSYSSYLHQHNVWRLLGFLVLPAGPPLCHCPRALRGAERCREPVVAWECRGEPSRHHAPPLPLAGSSFPSSPGTGAWQRRQPKGLLLAGVQRGLRNHQGMAFPPQPLEVQRWTMDRRHAGQAACHDGWEMDRCRAGQAACRDGWALPLHRDASGFSAV